MCVFCDNTSAINLSKNLVQHSKSKHIEIRYHFIRDLVVERVVCLEFIHTDNQKADIFTKPLDGPRFKSLRKTIGFGTIPWISCVMCASLVYIVLFCLWVVHFFLLIVNCFVCFCYFYIFAFEQFFIFIFIFFVCQKSKNHIKSRKSKVWLTVLSFVLKLVLPCTFVLMALYIYERSLFPSTLITVEEILESMWLL